MNNMHLKKFFSFFFFLLCETEMIKLCPLNVFIIHTTIGVYLKASGFVQIQPHRGKLLALSCTLVYVTLKRSKLSNHRAQISLHIYICCYITSSAIIPQRRVFFWLCLVHELLTTGTYCSLMVQ